MKKTLFTLFLFYTFTYAQNKQYTIDGSYFYGSILPHKKSILNLISAQPEGILLSFNKKTYGEKTWHSLYNYPNYGLSFQYQNNKNEILGNLYGIYAHMDFFFFNRNLQFRVGQGISYTTNPYDQFTNFQNVAYGASVMPSTYFMLNYHKPNLYKNIGLQTGFNFVHHSNANLKAPNTSTNTLAFTLGLNYQFQNTKIDTIALPLSESINKKINYNVFFRTGFCESDVPNSGSEPFYVATFMVDKKLNQKSTIQLGAEMFWMEYLKEFIKYQSIVFYEKNYDINADYKRVGAFIGHELAIGNLAIDTQIGFYLYDPSKKQGITYQRLGARYYINPNISAGISLKTHMAQAEALELSLGYRL